jgi:hypothetical protein
LGTHPCTRLARAGHALCALDLSCKNTLHVNTLLGHPHPSLCCPCLCCPKRAYTMSHTASITHLRASPSISFQVGVVLCVLFPLSLRRHIRALEKAATLGVVVVIVLVSLVVTKAIRTGVQGEKTSAMCQSYNQGVPELYIYAVFDRIFGDFPAKNTVYKHFFLVLADSTYNITRSLHDNTHHTTKSHRVHTSRIHNAALSPRFWGTLEVCQICQ